VEAGTRAAASPFSSSPHQSTTTSIPPPPSTAVRHPSATYPLYSTSRKGPRDDHVGATLCYVLARRVRYGIDSAIYRRASSLPCTPVSLRASSLCLLRGIWPGSVLRAPDLCCFRAFCGMRNHAYVYAIVAACCCVMFCFLGDVWDLFHWAEADLDCPGKFFSFNHRR
jgi:hypothetical protein